MDINYNLLQMSQYISYANEVLENINYSFSEFKGLFSGTQNAMEIISEKIKKTSSQLQELFGKISSFRDDLNKKILSVPEEKPYKDKPPVPNFEGQTLEDEKKKIVYELNCAKIDIENNKIKIKNENNNKVKTILNETYENLNNVLQKLEEFKNRCDYMKNFIKNLQSDFLSKKNESESLFNKSLSLANQSLEALSNTYSFAVPLTEECRHNKVHSDLRKIFKLKKSINQSINILDYDKKSISNESDNKQSSNNTQNKTILIKSRKSEEFYDELNSSNLKVGDIVKIPSYNLFNLGSSNLFDSMEKLGFKKLSNNGTTIFEDGTIAWVKYE